MPWARRHLLPITAAFLGACAFIAFSWAERGYFCDQARDHHSPCPAFWSAAHVHDWVYNGTANWQSDLLVGIFLLILLRRASGKGEDA